MGSSILGLMVTVSISSSISLLLYFAVQILSMFYRFSESCPSEATLSSSLREPDSAGAQLH